jgi:hypothetical protein
VHLWAWLVIGGVGALSLYGVFKWASADLGIGTENAKEHFRSEQDWRAMRRSGSGSAAIRENKELKTPV